MSTKTRKKKEDRFAAIKAARGERRQVDEVEDLDWDFDSAEAVIWRSDAHFGEFMREIRAQ